AKFTIRLESRRQSLHKLTVLFRAFTFDQDKQVLMNLKVPFKFQELTPVRLLCGNQIVLLRTEFQRGSRIAKADHSEQELRITKPSGMVKNSLRQEMEQAARSAFVQRFHLTTCPTRETLHQDSY